MGSYFQKVYNYFWPEEKQTVKEQVVSIIQEYYVVGGSIILTILVAIITWKVTYWCQRKKRRKAAMEAKRIKEAKRLQKACAARQRQYENLKSKSKEVQPNKSYFTINFPPDMLQEEINRRAKLERPLPSNTLYRKNRKNEFQSEHEMLTAFLTTEKAAIFAKYPFIKDANIRTSIINLAIKLIQEETEDNRMPYYYGMTNIMQDLGDFGELPSKSSSTTSVSTYYSETDLREEERRREERLKVHYQVAGLIKESQDNRKLDELIEKVESLEEMDVRAGDTTLIKESQDNCKLDELIEKVESLEEMDVRAGDTALIKESQDNCKLDELIQKVESLEEKDFRAGNVGSMGDMEEVKGTVQVELEKDTKRHTEIERAYEEEFYKELVAYRGKSKAVQEPVQRGVTKTTRIGNSKTAQVRDLVKDVNAAIKESEEPAQPKGLETDIKKPRHVKIVKEYAQYESNKPTPDKKSEETAKQLKKVVKEPSMVEIVREYLKDKSDSTKEYKELEKDVKKSPIIEMLREENRSNTQEIKKSPKPIIEVIQYKGFTIEKVQLSDISEESDVLESRNDFRIEARRNCKLPAPTQENQKKNKFF